MAEEIVKVGLIGLDQVVIVDSTYAPTQEEVSKEVLGRKGGMKPGVINGRRVYALSNTSKPRSRKRLEKAIEGWDKHIENHPRDAMAQRSRAHMVERLTGI